MKNVKFPCLVARLCWTLVGLLWFGALVLRADTHYVRTPETCTNTVLQSPYTNWDTAATQIQWAVSAAGDNDTVLISNGVYYLTNYITLGGSAPNLTVQSVNGPGATIIDGNYPLFSNRCFYVGTGTKIISGLTISNCYKADSGGGGIYVASGNAVITNCVFTTNRCISNGGAISIAAAMNTGLIADCVFSNNQANVYGGALYFDNAVTNVVVQNCSFVGNQANSYYGGALFLGAGTNIVVQDCSFVGNVVTSSANGYGGGIYIGGGIIRDCLIKNNTTALQGGGLYLNSGVVSNCTIINNIAVSNSSWWSGGGGVALKYGGIILNCTITGNNAAVYGGGILWAAWDANITEAVQNCLIAGNVASNQGGGIYAYPSGSDITNNVIIDNCTIVSNRAIRNYAGGMRIDASGSFYTNCFYVRNCIVASNSAPSSLDIYASGTNAYFFCCSPTFTSFPPGRNNTTNDPRFADPAAGNWRLANNSPCINTGTNRSWMTNSYDLDGRTRIRYGTVDMGAYEFIHHATMYQFR